MYKIKQPTILNNFHEASTPENQSSTIPKSPNKIILSPISANSNKNKSAASKLANFIKRTSNKQGSAGSSEAKEALVTSYNLPRLYDKSGVENSQYMQNTSNNDTLISDVQAGSKMPSRYNSISYMGEMDSKMFFNIDNSSDLSPKFNEPSRIHYMQNPDLVKQEEYINNSIHFSKYKRHNQLLGQLDKSKSWLSKEMFYYPEQIALNEMLKNNTVNTTYTEEDLEAGIMNIAADHRYTVNLMDRRSTFFKLPCYKKKFPIKFRVDLHSGAFEIYVSRNIKKPGIIGYDYMYSRLEFEVNYQDTTDLKNLYFSIYAPERLVMNFMCSFKAEVQEYNDSLPAIQQRVLLRKEKMKNRNKLYEFYNKDMTIEEQLKLKQLAETIRLEKKEKNIKRLGSQKDLIRENQMLAGNYEVIKTLKIAESGQRRDMKFENSKLRLGEIQKEDDKRRTYNLYRDEIRRVQKEWERSLAEKRRFKIAFIKTYLVTTALSYLCKTVLDKKRAAIFIKIIQRKKLERICKLQRSIKAFLNKPYIEVKEDFFNKTVVTNQEAKNRARILETLNLWACLNIKEQKENAGDLLHNFFFDLIQPTEIKQATVKYSEKISLVQFRWRKHARVNFNRVEKFLVYWRKYCQTLKNEEKNKTKKANIDFVQKFAEPQVREQARHFINLKLQEYVRALPKTNPTNLRDAINQALHTHKQEVAKRETTEGQDKSTLTPDRDKHNNSKETSRADNNPTPTQPEASHAVILNLKPTLEEMKQIYDAVVEGLKDDNKI